MPNHITNKLIINGSMHLIEQIIGSNDETNKDDYELDFKKIIPYSFEQEIPYSFVQEKDYNINNIKNWQITNWQITNWGTKSNAYDTIISSIIDNHVELKFQTEWFCPHIWFEKTVKLFPSLEFKLSWIDENYSICGLCGIYTG